MQNTNTITRPRRTVVRPQPVCNGWSVAGPKLTPQAIHLAEMAAARTIRQTVSLSR